MLHSAQLPPACSIMPKNKRAYSPVEGSSKKVRFGSEDPIDDTAE